MPLSPGMRLGPYEVVSAIGAGGMGEVWKARDLRLRRSVAIKVLPGDVARDPRRLARFLDEARAASALSHPGILTIHDFGDEGGIAYLVTELLEGRTLRACLEGGPLPPAQAADVGIQVARALAAAHGKGIVHRDVKPENLFVTASREVKVLDWGLATRADPPSPGECDRASTVSRRTEPGSVTGTAAYMAPEQVRGEPADARADVFALGCVLYEMVSGRRAFLRPTAVETMASILTEEPPPLEGPGLRSALGQIARQCLEKRPEDRYQASLDLAFALEAARLGALGAPSPPDTAPRRPGKVLRLLAAATLLAATPLGGLAIRALRGAGPPAAAGPGSVEPLTTDPGYEGEPSFSPDGQTIAYVSDRDGNFEIYLQQLSGGPAINLTRCAAGDIQPSFSPDGHEIAFVSSRAGSSDIFASAPGLPLVGGDIWVMPALGGPPRRIVESGNFPSWSPDGRTIVYTRGTYRDSRVSTVPVEGGVPRDVPLAGLTDARLCWPSYSRDGRFLLFQNGARILVAPAAGGAATMVAQGEHPAWGGGASTIVFTSLVPGQGRTLWTVPFSPKRGAVDGPATPLTFGRGADVGPAVSRDGRTIVYSSLDEASNIEAIAFDPEAGRPTGPPRALTAGSNHVGFADPSPDGSAVVFAARRGSASHLWRVDPPSVPVQFTFDRRWEDVGPRWSPDGGTIAFTRRESASPTEESAVWLMRPDGAGARRLTGIQGMFCWFRDGRRLLVQRGDDLVAVEAETGAEASLRGIITQTYFALDDSDGWLAVQTAARGNVDIEAVAVTGGRPRLVAATPGQDFHPFFSPSGRWLYFQTDHKNLSRVPGPAQSWRSGPPERVTAFPESGLYLEDPHTSRDGRILVYTRNSTVGDLWVLRLPAAPRPDA